jgi:hypothetical protein
MRDVDLSNGQLCPPVGVSRKLLDPRVRVWVVTWRLVHIQAEWDPSDPVGETGWFQSIADGDLIGAMSLAIVGFANFPC